VDNCCGKMCGGNGGKFITILKNINNEKRLKLGIFFGLSTVKFLFST